MVNQVDVYIKPIEVSCELGLFYESFLEVGYRMFLDEPLVFSVYYSSFTHSSVGTYRYDFF